MAGDAFAAAFATRSRLEWEDRFEGIDTAVSPVLELAEAFERAGVGETLDVVVPHQGVPHGHERRYATHPGSDTADVLRGLGLDDAEIAALREAGAVT
jgi:alpha-methylacyl-CoA racemase